MTSALPLTVWARLWMPLNAWATGSTRVLTLTLWRSDRFRLPAKTDALLYPSCVWNKKKTRRPCGGLREPSEYMAVAVVSALCDIKKGQFLQGRVFSDAFWWSGDNKRSTGRTFPISWEFAHRLETHIIRKYWYNANFVLYGTFKTTWNGDTASAVPSPIKRECCCSDRNTGLSSLCLTRWHTADCLWKPRPSPAGHFQVVVCAS